MKPNLALNKENENENENKREIRMDGNKYHTLRLVFTSYDKESLDTYVKMVSLLLTQENIIHDIELFSVFSLPIKKEDITVLKSPHVYKKAKDHYFINRYKKVITLIIPLFFIETIITRIVSNLPKSLELTINHNA